MGIGVSDETLFDFLNADPALKRRMLEREPGLLTENSARSLEEIASAQTDQALAGIARAHAALVRDCEAHGVAAVFDAIEREYADSSATGGPDLSALLERIEALQLDPERAAESAHLCSVALGLVTPNGDAELWALLHGVRAIALRALGERDGSMQGLQAAVADCDEALKFFSLKATPVDWAKTQLNRAGAIIGIGELAGDPAYWHSAIEGLDAALACFTPASHRDDWAMCRMNRGLALQRIGQSAGDADLLRDAVAELDAALEVFVFDRTPGEWAMTQLNRGVAQLSLGDLTGDASIVSQSIGAFDAASIFFTRESGVVLWTRTRQNRANALQRLSELAGDPAAARASLADYDELLEVLTRENSSSEWGIACMNRANALLLLYNLEESPSSLTQALSAYDAALEIFTREGALYYWAAIQHNRASALVRRGQDLGDPSFVREALKGLDAVLEVSDRDASPADWAAARIARALALRVLGRLTKDSTPLRDSVRDCDAAIGALSRERSPAAWATAHQNRADAQVDLGNLTGDASMREAAVVSYKAALEALTMEEHPDQSMEVSSVLIRQLFLLHEYGQVRERLDKVLMHGIRHLVAIENLPARERAVQQAAGLAELRAWMAIAVEGDGEAALLWLERARGQLLALALSEDPQLAASAAPPELSSLLRAMPAGGAAVLPIISPVDARIAVIPAGRTTVFADDFLKVPELTHDRLIEWFYGPRDVPGIGGYLGAYADGRATWPRESQSGGDKEGLAFPDVLSATLDLVSKYILSPADERLRAHGLGPGAPVVIVPTGLLSMLPLWATPCGSDPAPFGERWTVSHAPSLGVLAVGSKRAADWLAGGEGVAMLALIDPVSEGQSALGGAALEGRMLERAVPRARLLSLTGADASADAVRAGLAGRTHLHFSTHGHYVPTAPSSSAVLLAGTDRLTLGELQKLDTIDRLRLVVLSACDTGLPGLQRGRADEFIGLPAGFIQAGAAAVIASHWPVRDDATFFLMWKFYDQYLDANGNVTRSPAEALRLASLWLRSVTCQDLQALFEPMRDSDGSSIPRTIDRDRPRGSPADAAREPDKGKLPPASASVISFAAWRKFRRVEDLEPALAASIGPSVAAITSGAYYLGDDMEGWELRRPFADPVHWAAFSITGI